MKRSTTRRGFLGLGSLFAGLFGAGAVQAEQDQDEFLGQIPPIAPGDPSLFPRFQRGAGGPIGSASDRGKLTRGFRQPGLPPVPVSVPEVPRLPWKYVNGAKEFHLIAEVVRAEMLPGQHFYVWGFNGSMPGPTIEVNRGDRVRFVVHNRLPEPTSVHWHGLEMPNRFDGVEGVTQEPIPPGETFVYEFDLHQEGTFFYHSHGAMQEIMGMTGLFIIHPNQAFEPAVDQDFALLFQEWAILPQAFIPNSTSPDFNWFTVNGKAGPYTTPLIIRHGSRVRIRFMNLSAMDHHPIHIHGHTFWTTGTEGGRIPESAWIPGNTQLVGVAQVRDIEFIANNVGDWLLHCHIPHHMMNHMTSMVGPARMLQGVERFMGEAVPGGAGGAGMGGMGGGREGNGGGRHLGLGMGLNMQEGVALAPVAGVAPTPVNLPNALEIQPGYGQIVRGPALRDDNRPSIGRGLGPQTNPDHATRTGPVLGPGQEGNRPSDNRYDDPRWQVPGFPQDMMKMKEIEWSAEELAKIKGKPQTYGMRSNWHIGVRAMMTLFRVLPEDLYDKVMAGEMLPDGASVPGSGKDEGQPKDKDIRR